MFINVSLRVRCGPEVRRVLRAGRRVAHLTDVAQERARDVRGREPRRCDGSALAVVRPLVLRPLGRATRRSATGRTPLPSETLRFSLPVAPPEAACDSSVFPVRLVGLCVPPSEGSYAASCNPVAPVRPVARLPVRRAACCFACTTGCRSSFT